MCSHVLSQNSNLPSWPSQGRAIPDNHISHNIQINNCTYLKCMIFKLRISPALSHISIKTYRKKIKNTIVTNTTMVSGVKVGSTRMLIKINILFLKSPLECFQTALTYRSIYNRSNCTWWRLDEDWMKISIDWK